MTQQTDSLSEGAFLDACLGQLRTGQRQPLISLTAADLAALAEESIGEDFLRYPFFVLSVVPVRCHEF